MPRKACRVKKGGKISLTLGHLIIICYIVQ
jgi:hypothetical protein